MQYMHDLGSNRINVFLSSSMGSPLDEQQREAIMAFFDRARPWFDLYAVENTADPRPIEEAYLSRVADADVILLVLQKELKAGVKKEYLRAKQLGKRVFAFIHIGEMSSELKQFIEADVQRYCTTTKFYSTRDLINQIEATLLTDVAWSYKRLYEANKQLRLELQRGSSYPADPGASVLYGGERLGQFGEP